MQMEKMVSTKYIIKRAGEEECKESTIYQVGLSLTKPGFIEIISSQLHQRKVASDVALVVV